jgi:uncharacterized protein YndB with AHSA1/START domain
MSDEKSEPQNDGIELAYELDAPPQKVWRAISVPELRDNWLPRDALTEGEPTSVTPGEEVRYRMRDDAPPFLESIVTFRIEPSRNGGTILRIIHQLTDARFAQVTKAAANSNSPPLMLAA